MNRQIKFRGTDFSGKVHYGNYAEIDACHYIIENCAWHDVKKYRVKPDTVAQLIATDRNGYEVYEGDPIRLADGWRCTATFRHFGAIVDGDATLITEE